ncbi:MAG: M20/M25/M40 family metallo-hydrolase [Candidatus Zixiibacteriota bacterium]|nr:MAG: M20/M25/M40 family metallo-hydrolase [candidate division Zixibacteria bacterium]
MTIRTVTPVVVLLALASFSVATAEDVALISVNSRDQVDEATAILGYAYGKIGERFLTIVNEAASERLAAAGIAVEIIQPGVVSQDLYLILEPARRAGQTYVDLQQLGRTMELEPGVHMVQMSSATASLSARTMPFMTIPLLERPIRFHYNPPLVPVPAYPPDGYPTDTLAALVDQDTLFTHTQRLQDFHTRYIGTDSIDRARDWIAQKFLDYGYTDVTTPEFDAWNWWRTEIHTCYNVRAVKPGVGAPDEIVVVGAHYDAIMFNQPYDPWDYSPGADDNASGVAMVLEVAKMLADIPTRRTVVFEAYSAEESGVYGSDFSAAGFEAAGADLIVMFNGDMIGFTGGEPWDVDLNYHVSDNYAQLAAVTGGRVSTAIPWLEYVTGGSDDRSFYNRGYNTVFFAERHFNNDGWHTVLDITSRMDFPFMTEVVRMAVATIALTAQAPSSPVLDTIIDVGDGQSLEISWSDCQDDLDYVIHRGYSSGEYFDSVVVGPCTGSDSYVWSGLTEGVDYYFMVVGYTPNGYQSLFAREVSLDPQLYPRSPVEFSATTDSASVLLNWQANAEADFSYYNLYRRISGVGSYELLESGVTMAGFVDTSAHGGSTYDYVITAVDADGYESDPSAGVSALSAAFNGGPCIVDAFCTENQYMPDQEHQEAYFDTLMGDRSHTVLQLDEVSDVLTRAQAGRYSTIIWIDDDYTLTNKTIFSSNDALYWYAGYGANILISGFQTIQFWTGTPVPEDHVLYTDFGVSGYDYWSSPDFVGAHGQNGWPSVEIEPGRGLMEYGYIPVLDTLPGATVIYTYDSFIDWPDWEGKPVGVIWEGAAGKRILLSFPIYYLSPASAQAMMAKVLEYFADPFEPVNEGDANEDGVVDIGDLTAMIDYLFISYTPPESLNGSDVNADCAVDMGDITWMIKYLFIGGAPPLAGCVE